MKRWALLTVVLYVLCLAVVAGPLLVVLDDKAGGGDRFGPALTLYMVYSVPILVLVQVALLLIPVAVVQERPIKRRKIIVSAVLGAIPMGAMSVGFLFSIVLMIWTEKGLPDTAHVWFTALAAFWSVWGIIFWRTFSTGNQSGLTSTMTRWLLRGSILEVLVAIPSHIISRHRNECCAPIFTLLGLATGLSIALLSFGPGIFFMFARRIKDKRRSAAT